MHLFKLLHAKHISRHRHFYAKEISPLISTFMYAIPHVPSGSGLPSAPRFLGICSTLPTGTPIAAASATPSTLSKTSDSPSELWRMPFASDTTPTTVAPAPTAAGTAFVPDPFAIGRGVGGSQLVVRSL